MLTVRTGVGRRVHVEDLYTTRTSPTSVAGVLWSAVVSRGLTDGLCLSAEDGFAARLPRAPENFDSLGIGRHSLY